MRKAASDEGEHFPFSIAAILCRVTPTLADPADPPCGMAGMEGNGRGEDGDAARGHAVRT
jgi:hypothetical protein